MIRHRPRRGRARAAHHASHHTPHRTPHRRARLAGVLAVLFTVVGFGWVAPTTATAQATPDFSLAARSPWVGAEDTLFFDLRTVPGAAGIDELADLQVRLRLDRAVDSVNGVDASLEGDTGTPIHGSVRDLDALPPTPEGNRRFSVRITAEPVAASAVSDTFRLREPGIYPAVLTLQRPDGTVVATIRTPVVRLDPDSPPRVVHPVVRIAIDPTITPTGEDGISGRELDRLDRLAAVLSGAAGAAPLPATISAVPDTIAALTRSTDPRALRMLDALAGGTADAGSPSVPANQLRTVLAQPAVALSPVALADAGLDAMVRLGLDAGRSTLGSSVAGTIDPTLWDGDLWSGIDPLDLDGARILRDAGYTHRLIHPGATPAPEDAGPDDASQDDAGPDVGSAAGRGDEPEVWPVDVPVDLATTAMLTGPAAAGVDAGEIALARMVAGSVDATIVAIDHVAATSALGAVAPLVALPDSPVVFRPFDTDAQDRETPDPDRLDPDGLDPDQTAVLPTPDRAAPDLTGVASGVIDATFRLASLRATVGIDHPTVIDAGRRLLTAVAVDVGDRDRPALVRAARGAMEDSFATIRIAGETDLNLTSRRGTLPVTITNGTGGPIDLIVDIRSDRLRFPDLPDGGLAMRVESGSTRIDIPVEALATGSVPTFVEVRSADGSVAIDMRQLNVRSSAVSGAGLALSLGAIAVLVVWWVRTWRNNRRHGAHEA